MAGNYRIRFRTLHIVSQQESGGDEPYLIVMGFRSRFMTPGSTTVFWNGPLFELAKSAKTGAKLSIPRDMGEITFPNVVRLTLQDIVDGKRPEILGEIVICLESDATPFRDIRKLINEKVKVTVDQQVRRLIEEGRIDLTNPSLSIEEAIGQIKRTLVPSVGEVINLWIRSWSDPDDIIGMTTGIWAAVDEPIGRIPKLSSQNFTHEFKDDKGAKYLIHGALIEVGSIRSFLLSLGQTANRSLSAVMKPETSVRRWLET